MSARCDVAVVGAGPAGAAAAAVLAAAGRAVALFDRDAFPRDKLCGEFLSGEARGTLEAIGAWPEVATLQPPPIERGAIVAASGRRIEVELPRTALGVSRRALDAAMVHAAVRAGAELHPETEVVSARDDGEFVALETRARDGHAESIRARLVVVAHGRRSVLDRPLARRGSGDLVGVKQHHRLLAGSDPVTTVEVYAFAGGYCGVSPIEADRVNVCALLRADLVRGVHGRDFPSFATVMAAASPALGARLRDLEPTTDPMLSVAGVGLGPRPTSRQGILFIGDAAGMIAPFCGNGLAMAMESGVLVAARILSVANPGSDRQRLAHDWSEQHRHRFATRLSLGRWLQPLLMRRLTSELAVRMLGHVPQTTTWLARRSRG